MKTKENENEWKMKTNEKWKGMKNENECKMKTTENWKTMKTNETRLKKEDGKNGKVKKII